jgi:hypothetical protein
VSLLAPILSDIYRVRRLAAAEPATMRPMAKPPMVQKTYRVPTALYEAAMKKATEREENLSDIIREALERYVQRS